MDLSLLNLMCGHLGFSCMKSLHMERFLIQVWACVYTITLYLYFGVKNKQTNNKTITQKIRREELASHSSNSSDLENVLQVMLLL